MIICGRTSNNSTIQYPTYEEITTGWTRFDITDDCTYYATQSIPTVALCTSYRSNSFILIPMCTSAQDEFDQAILIGDDAEEPITASLYIIHVDYVSDADGEGSEIIFTKTSTTADSENGESFFDPFIYINIPVAEEGHLVK